MQLFHVAVMQAARFEKKLCLENFVGQSRRFRVPASRISTLRDLDTWIP